MLKYVYIYNIYNMINNDNVMYNSPSIIICNSKNIYSTAIV